MSYAGDAAEQVVRMSLEGTEVAVKIAGEGAKQAAILIYAILRQQQKTQGKTRLVNMLKSGRELKVFAVRDDELKTFCRAAKNYGVLYCVLKDRDATDGITDIMVRAEDAAKINRIFERFHLAEVKAAEQTPKQNENMQDKQDKLEQFLDELLKPREEKDHPEVARRESDNPSEPTSERKETDGVFTENTRPSVRQAIREIQKKRQEKPLPQNSLERINKVIDRAKER